MTRSASEHQYNNYAIHPKKNQYIEANGFIFFLKRKKGKFAKPTIPPPPQYQYKTKVRYEDYKRKKLRRQSNLKKKP